MEYYSRPYRLEIERISGAKLPMEQCYINLAIVERSKKEITKEKNSPFSLFARLKVDEAYNTGQVDLPDLFSPRKLSDGTTITPRRILIRGDAGVGKTTLCKKIVHDYVHQKIWKQFDCLLWIPLRQLKTMTGQNYTLRNLIHKIFFSTRDEGQNLAETLAKSINSSSVTNGVYCTLFLLDGLDEVSDLVSSEESIGSFLGDLLHRPNVIITSRPQGLNKNSLGPLDLEMETTGFRPEQVEAYVNNREIVADPKNADEIQLFLKNNPLLQGLVRIPIQLDALCYSWNLDDFSNDTPKTMTNIYQSIARKLWQKDILSLGKEHNGERLKERTVKELDQWDIESVTSVETDLLSGLAFFGLYDNIIEFNAKYRARIRKLWDQEVKVPFAYNDIFKRLSFLRTSDSTLPDSDQTYHFLHLTFQEFFAAQYFVKHWGKGSDLLCPVLSTKSSIAIGPKEFLRREKYNPRYNIFWRFVVGLLQADLTKELLSFFQLLEAEPRDLLGPSHQRIVMHCLCELAVSNLEASDNDFKDFRCKIENQLYHWLLLEIKIMKYPTFIYQREVPEHLLKRLLEEGDGQEKELALEALSKRPGVTSNILDIAVSLLNTCPFQKLRMKLIDMLASHSKSLSTSGTEALVASLKDQDKVVRCAAASALGRQPSLLSQEILARLVVALEDGDRGVRSAAAYVLGRQPSLPQEILARLVAAALEDGDRGVRSAAAYALGRQPSLPQEILARLVAAALEDGDSGVRSEAATALGRQPRLLR